MKYLIILLISCAALTATATTPPELFRGLWKGHAITKYKRGEIQRVETRSHYVDGQWISSIGANNTGFNYTFKITEIDSDRAFFKGEQTDPGGLKTYFEGYCWSNTCSYDYVRPNSGSHIFITDMLLTPEKLVRNFFAKNTTDGSIFFIGKMEFEKQK